MLKILLAMALVLMVTLTNCNAWAENWINIAHNDDYRLYIETDSYQYNKDNALTKIWTKLDNNEKSLVAYEYVDLNSRSIAHKSYIIYENNTSVDNGNFSDFALEYIPVAPGSMGERIYKVIDAIAKLDKGGFDWEFYDTYVPEPSAIDSDAWKPVGSATDPSFIDSRTKSVIGDKTYVWVKFKNGEDTALQYQINDDKKQKTAGIKQVYYSKDNIKHMEITMPVLIWIGAEGISEELNKILMQIAFIDFL